jgi:SAM-dependent methyltransferase
VRAAISEKRRQRIEHLDQLIDNTGIGSIADMYNRAGSQYVRYADGDPDRLFCFEGLHAYADQRLWAVLERKLRELRAMGRSALRVLDAGCGPGTWLRRCVTHAYRLGFSQVAARGFDVAKVQIEAARRMSARLAAVPGVDLTFEVADLTDRLPEADDSVDLSLCLYSVLSHLPVAALPRVASEFARVARGPFIATARARAIGSAPTAFIGSMEETRHLRLDHMRDRCEIELRTGRRTAVGFHLFTASERNCFGAYFKVEELSGLDIFHSRFALDRRWNPPSAVPDQAMLSRLADMEKACASDPHFMEHAMHLLLVGAPWVLPGFSA